MPSVIALKDCLGNTKEKQKDLYFLVKEEDFPMEGVIAIQTQIKQFIKETDEYTRDDLIAIVEEVIDEYYGTLIPFKLYLVSY
ncbi:hypothetical protein [Methanosarcina sp. 1.H.A.2.2]|uniref:hypothetical protein n=1 Tax=Methanosarcina sp. 1.H.A.2.2 TaxID=1483601 RepID=UPI000621B0BB|nr:hypothetical protein [Methanosarcina sp. 1.H.A.2.2]KKH50167.1 hypothetical protein EO93_04415 [Methanosarcina sp. 1.H.A.2.2]